MRQFGRLSAVCPSPYQPPEQRPSSRGSALPGLTLQDIVRTAIDVHNRMTTQEATSEEETRRLKARLVTAERDLRRVQSELYSRERQITTWERQWEEKLQADEADSAGRSQRWIDLATLMSNMGQAYEHIL